MKDGLAPQASQQVLPQTPAQAAPAALASRLATLLQTQLTLAPHQLDADFVESGLVDSAGFMELFCLLEEAFGIVIDADDLDLAHFRTLPAMVGFIQCKLAGMARGTADVAEAAR